MGLPSTSTRVGEATRYTRTLVIIIQIYSARSKLQSVGYVCIRGLVKSFEFNVARSTVLWGSTGSHLSLPSHRCVIYGFGASSGRKFGEIDGTRLGQIHNALASIDFPWFDVSQMR